MIRDSRFVQKNALSTQLPYSGSSQASFRQSGQNGIFEVMYASSGRHGSVQEKSAQKSKKWLSNWLQKIQAVRQKSYFPA